MGILTPPLGPRFFLHAYEMTTFAMNTFISMWLLYGWWTWNGTPTLDFFLSPPPPPGFFCRPFSRSPSNTAEESNTHAHTYMQRTFHKAGDAMGDSCPCLPFFLPFLALSPLVWYVGTSEKENGEIWAVSVLRTACTCVRGCKGSALLVVSGAFLRFMVGLFLRASKCKVKQNFFIYVVYKWLGLWKVK